jgi:hypothetical protein
MLSIKKTSFLPSPFGVKIFGIEIGQNVGIDSSPILHNPPPIALTKNPGTEMLIPCVSIPEA